MPVQTTSGQGAVSPTRVASGRSRIAYVAFIIVSPVEKKKDSL